MHLPVTESIEQLQTSGQLFLELFTHGTLSVEIYKPDKTDLQQPHDRDEVYIVIAGKGVFFNDGLRKEFGPGDFLFVPAETEHRFEDFTDDFITWVLFYGPTGGEKNIKPDAFD